MSCTHQHRRLQPSAGCGLSRVRMTIKYACAQTLLEKLRGSASSADSDESGGLEFRLLLSSSRTSSLVYAGTNHLTRLQVGQTQHQVAGQ